MTTALVTGSHGWVGAHLRTLLAARGYRVVGLGRQLRIVSSGESYVQVDLRDLEEVTSAVDEVRPDMVFHLAAATPQCVSDVGRLVADCVLTTHNVCTALRTAADTHMYEPHLVLAGSSAQYGAVPREQNPISEWTLPQPTGAYGYAKAAAEAVAFAMAADGRISVTAARPFNHVGPGEHPTTVAGALARRVADVAAGRAERVRVADLEAVRDFTDVRDVARAYIELAERGLPNKVYNICSSRGVNIQTVLERLLDDAGLDWSTVEVIPGSSDVRYQVGSPSSLEAQTQWKAEIPLQRSLHDLLTEVMTEAGRNNDGIGEGMAWKR